MERQNRQNYQREMDQLIQKLESEGRVPSLFLHACCAPCSSYVLEYLSRYFDITLFYYNPNISPAAEYTERVEEVKRLLREMPLVHPVHFMEGSYNPEVFYEAVKGHEEDPERGERCTICYRLRLEEAARLAAEGGFDYFTTTLSISPLKDCERLNAIGDAMGEKYGAAHLHADFKKKNGYRRSTELSREYHLYRQNYCGCVFSKKEAEEREKMRLSGNL
ncbi:MAG: epoxyqueuosine reductase QueH [Clostridium sp.]|nr:epoxyqueuosine reductase QueH [Clostridium sp.]MBP3215691.1 epoxyqueuosine reductase QueH [Clostridium sp.]